jgi:hypothetical protein
VIDEVTMVDFPEKQVVADRTAHGGVAGAAAE